MENQEEKLIVEIGEGEIKYAVLYGLLWLVIFDILHHYFGESEQYQYFLLKNNDSSNLRDQIEVAQNKNE